MKRRLKRELNINKKVIAVLAIFLAVGFAYITSAVNIGGVFTLFKSTWDIHFDNVQVTSGSVGATTPSFDSQHPELDLSVSLTDPGDYYEFTIDAVNNGDIDGMLDTFSDLGLTEEQLAYLKYTVTYADGEELAQYQELNAGDTCTFKIRIEFRDDIQAEDLPAGGASLNLGFDVSYVRADSNRIRRRAENTLYNVLKNEAESGGLAKKYTGAHQDSMDASKSTKDIYHWYADNDTDGTAITNKNNVIFANHCWQMIRTTDTGGVKMIYNGEVDNNQCLNTRSNHIGFVEIDDNTMSSSYYYGTSYDYNDSTQLFSLSGTVTTGDIKIGQYTCKTTASDGTCSILYYVESLESGNTYYVISLDSNSHYSEFGNIQFNENNSSPAYVGYMYNKVYEYRSRSLNYLDTMISVLTLNTSYWYGEDAVWGSPTANKYNLINAYQVNDSAEYPNLVGKYTFLNNNQSYTNSFVYYIVGIDDSTMYAIKLESGNNLEYYNDKYTYGESYTDNGDGTYTINNPITIERKDWPNIYSNVGPDKYICKNAVNNKCSELLYSLTPELTYLPYYKSSSIYKYANNFTYNNGEYTLNDNGLSIWNYKDDDKILGLKNAHYTCFNESGVCNTIYYVYSITNRTSTWHINIQDGKNVETAIDEMLFNDDVNTKNSSIKSAVDSWYKRYMLDYSDYLEDVIYCNNRSIKEYNGWNPNGGDLSLDLRFKDFELNNDLSCENITDKFSTLNSKALLTYPVGLISSSELNLINSDKARKTGQWYWTSSPSEYNEYFASGRYIVPYGYIRSTYILSENGVRPAISLLPSTVYTSGDGSMESPYVIYTE